MDDNSAERPRYGWTPKQKKKWVDSLPEFRRERLIVLSRAFTRFNNDINAAIKSRLEEVNAEKQTKLLEDPWFRKDFTGILASDLLEEGLFLNLLEKSLEAGGSALTATHKTLMSLNKDRYNPGVQTAATANEGLASALQAIAKRPRSHAELVQILVVQEKFIPIKDMAALEVPTLDEAIEMAKVDGKYIENKRIREDKDLTEANE